VANRELGEKFTYTQTKRGMLFHEEGMQKINFHIFHTPYEKSTCTTNVEFFFTMANIISRLFMALK
jgi:hypothetical protein